MTESDREEIFNIVKNLADPNRLHLYEVYRVYREAAAFEEHKNTPHFVRWVETTKDWLAQPLDIATGFHLFAGYYVWKKQI